MINAMSMTEIDQVGKNLPQEHNQEHSSALAFRSWKL